MFYITILPTQFSLNQVYLVKDFCKDYSGKTYLSRIRMLAEIMSIIFVDLDTWFKLNLAEGPSPECQMIKTDLLW